MIETAEAVANADAIAATDGIDCLLIGTSDLTADMGISGQAEHPRVQAAYKAVIDAKAFSGAKGIFFMIDGSTVLPSTYISSV